MFLYPQNLIICVDTRPSSMPQHFLLAQLCGGPWQLPALFPNLPAVPPTPGAKCQASDSLTQHLGAPAEPKSSPMALPKPTASIVSACTWGTKPRRQGS